MLWEVILFGLFRRLKLFIQLHFVFYDTLALFKQLNLSIKFVHFILILENHVFIDVSNFELEVLRTHGK